MAIALAPAAAEVAEGVGARAAAGAAAKKSASSAKAAPKKVDVPEPKAKPKTSGIGDKVQKGADVNEALGVSKMPSSSKGGKKSPSVGKKFVGKIGGKNLLIAELTTCMVILIFGTFVAPQGSHDGVTRMMVKGSGLLAVFFILSIVSAGGGGPQKVASSLGLLITLSYVLTSSDMHNIWSWIAKFFGKPSQPISETENPLPKAGG